MGRPRLIILIRHAQSEGNKNRDIHQTIPDHRVKLTPDGWQQAYEAGRRLRALLRADDTLQFFTSPYRRTRETTEGILATLTSDDPAPSAFRRNNIKVYEEPRLREQDFGNFQPCSAEMERMWQERADYGHFFYRIPNGESAADAYDRISGFNESLWRQFGEDDFPSVCVLVTHGLMSRVFLMKWYHFSVEYFEDLRNVNHCEFLIMRRNDESGKYLLENKLRTWSELKRERALQLEKENGENKDGKENGVSKDVATLTRSSTFEVRRRWGGCPNGCNHDKSFKIQKTLADLVKSDSIVANRASGLSENGGGGSGSSSVSGGSSTAVPSPAVGLVNPSFNGTALSTNNSSTNLASRRPAAKRFQSQTTTTTTAEECIDAAGFSVTIDVTRARDEIVSSPDGTPSFISVDDRLRSRLKSPNLPPHQQHHQLHVGRDFGGTYSGHSSVVSGSGSEGGASDSESADDDREKGGGGAGTAIPGTPIIHGKTNGTSTPNNTLGVLLPSRRRDQQQREQSRMGRGARANRLGDHHSSDGEHEADGEHEPGGVGVEADEESGGEAEEMTDEADEVMSKEEIEDRSIMGSVY